MFRPSSSSSSSSSWNRPPIPAYCIPSADFWSRKYTEENLLLSRAYTSSGARFRNVVHKALRGEPIKMGVLGGSVSRGRNVENGPTYHQRIFRMWNETFFPHPGNEIVDGSRAATGSKYFSMCFPAHIPEDVDIVLLELSINDRRIDDAEAWETLVRALLELPNKPAVISTSTFALQFSQGLGVGGDLHLGVAQYYDIPVISLRNPLLPYLFSTPALEWELFGYSKGLDRRHLNALGHELLADFTTHWMREQVCKVLSEHVRFSLVYGSRKATDGDGGQDAPPRANVQPSWWTAPVDLSQVPRPSCRSTSSLPRLQPTSSDGWTFESAPGEKFYWSAEEPGARITFPIRTVEGRVGVFFLRSAGMRLGNARCWVDRDASFGELAVGYWEKEQ
ncbi:hypothetical protein CALVIDRAFT_489907 [Calocera viscosa TUFC12733]|uniref:Uncharacterized protein n=1 Tax=Calocera viscosa (strain TUFC12733) TaxID=1330018 RepID=A0A167GQJ0_CALVF|nr:hypothetical protein CALVIDRAFT_489907 [Calocera viscosa TUFC12733]